MNIGTIIKEYRQKNNITPTSFGKAEGVNKQTVSKWEKGIVQPSVRKIFEIASALRIPVDDLMMMENEHVKERPFIFVFKTKYNVGLNSVYLCVHDFDSFCSFIDTLNALRKVLEPDSYLLGFLLLEMTYKNERSKEEAIPIKNICWNRKSIIIEISEHELVLGKENILRIERVASFNNETYAFNIYYKKEQDTFIQLIIGFNNGSRKEQRGSHC